MKPKMQFVKSF